MTADDTAPVPNPFGAAVPATAEPAPGVAPAAMPAPAPPSPAATTTVIGSDPMAAPPPPAPPTGYPAPSLQGAVPRRSRHPVVAFLRSPIEAASWWSLFAIVLGLFIAVTSFAVVTTLFSTGGSLLFLLVGIPVIALGLEAARMFARVERWRMGLADARPLVPHPYRPVDWSPREPFGAWLRQWAEGTFLDASRWLDVAYAVVALPLAVFEFVTATVVWSLAIGLLLTPIVYLTARSAGLDPVIFTGRLNLTPEWALAIGFIVGLVLLPVAASVTRGLAMLHRAVAQGLLCADPNEALRRDVVRLRDSRSAALELEASELRRIERDLHDGAQQRLVKLAIDLSLAEQKFDTDPDGARALIGESRDQARQALAELREVVRGAAPAILMDRGLTAAIASVAGRNAVPTFLDSGLPANQRLPHAVERAAYYVVTEALANVAKHSGASRCDVFLRMVPGYLMAEVRDDGHGTATAVPGGGLAGLRDRVEALDGRLDISSPAGGPTIIRAWIPVPA
jgi:signal transduction histidine kinase